MKLHAKRILALSLLAALLAGIPALADFEAVVTSTSMKVYRQAEPHDQIGALPMGTVVTVKDYNGKAALISYNGNTGIVRINDLQRTIQGPATPETTAKVMYTGKDARVYRNASVTADSAKVAAGVQVNVLSVSGDWAKVERKGVVGYMDINDLSETKDAEPEIPIFNPTPEAAPEPEPEDENTPVRYENKTVMTKETCPVYAEPSTASARFTLDANVIVTLVATRGSWAMIKKSGNVGYVDADLLTTEVRAVEVDTADIKPSAGSDSGIFGSGTNEEIIFKFLTREMGLNAAAACGVVSNVKHESDYKTTCVGDNGTSYGICQWHASRKTRLINWCDSHNYDYKSLKGQLYYLQYELKTYYPTVLSKLKAVSNTAQGAYDAGYQFCYSFEAPANRAARSNTRGNYAKDTLWKKYKT